MKVLYSSGIWFGCVADLYLHGLVSEDDSSNNIEDQNVIALQKAKIMAGIIAINDEVTARKWCFNINKQRSSHIDFGQSPLAIFLLNLLLEAKKLERSSSAKFDHLKALLSQIEFFPLLNQVQKEIVYGLFSLHYQDTDEPME